MNIQLYIEIFYAIILLFVCLRIIYEVDTISKIYSYLLVVIFLPIIGMVVYFAMGNNYRKNKLYSKKLTRNNDLFSRVRHHINQSSIAIIKDGKPSYLKDNPQLAYLLLHDKSPITKNNEVKLLLNGEETFPEIIRALKAAQNHIHIEYYIFEDDKIGCKIKDVLIEKAKQGISVRFIYDDFGSRSIRKRIVKELKDNGVEVYRFYKINFISLANRINYRNHRKIIVIDGETAFVGGINISERYSNPNPYQLYWRDTHIKIKGSGTANLQYIFLCDWNFCTGNQIAINESFFRTDLPTEAKVPLQIAASGPDSDSPTILYSIIQAISKAKHEVLITTPYFIPDESLINIIKIAALSGVSIKLIVPKKGDSFLVNAAACSFYSELIDAGVEIYLYTKGFIHAKTLVIDEAIAMVGTANMDIRSFELNFEVNAVIYDNNFAKEMRKAFENDLLDSIKINEKEWNERSKWKTFSEKIARLFSPLL
ncbi:cardiolipin synthase [Pedobacter changchengzhani]|uniref:Cardiolipin synthase n=1 Tax=Pedobacter changchengzhani TaxID=2529274 RepID=A0A4R5MN27_9SPHI|nr:cardiolipin synthase [Pedobacter changchengzhani]TDG36705.1 cardiolipin synthase [Pedobacter changchengzhani]